MTLTAVSPNAIFSRQGAGEQQHHGATLLSRGEAAGGHAKAAAVHLTPRQLEVLSLLCEGLPNKLICRRLNISPGTVKVHIGSIFRELGVSSRLQAVILARRSGLDLEAAAAVPADAYEADVSSSGSLRRRATSDLAVAA